ncbi:aminopeptidase [Chitinimonas naiadis]
MHRALALLVCLLSLSGCSSLAYLGQAANGQSEVLRNARPIDEVIADPATAPALADKLRLAQRLRLFAVQELKLPDNASYTRYADLGRPYALWNVVSTPALSLKPVLSCFPIAGCLAYRGYYSEADAKSYAAERRAAGDDVFLYGVAAYSTLGWFSDPLLNTTARYDEASLARLIFHELAHQLIYIKDDSAFNEAFATAVELEGYERWLRREGDERSLAGYQREEQQRQAFRQLMETGRRQLAELYEGAGSVVAKQQSKADIQAGLVQDYRNLKQALSATSWGYDQWFQPAPNNAHFVALATYHEKVPALRALFRQQGGDFAAFYEAVRLLGQKNRAARDETLAALTSVAVSGEKQRGATNSQTTP